MKILAKPNNLNTKMFLTIQLRQEGQVVLNYSPEFCLKLTYRYLLKAGHVPVDTWGKANFGPRGII